jgi:hypothetical protein
MKLKKSIRSILSTLGFLPLAFFSDDLRAEQFTELLSSTRLVTQLQLGKTNGANADLLIPLLGDASEIWYGNLQAYGYGTLYRTMSAGSGYRLVIDDAIYGAYGFFDRQISPNKIYYNRLNLGWERLSNTWDFRLNIYYYPSAKQTNLIDKGIQSPTVQGTSIIYPRLYEIEAAYSGADVEVGHTLGYENFRGYLGYYNFSDVIQGPKARVEYQFNSRVALSAATQHDVRGWLTYAGISYWFGNTTLPGVTGIRARLLDPVVRDMTVATALSDSYTEYEVDPRNIYFADPTATAGSGTEANPYSIQEAFSAARQNDIIYLMGSDQAFDISNGVTLQPGQTLWGSTENLYAKGFLLLPGDPSQPVILKNGGITLNNSASLSGFILDGSAATNTTNSQSGITINDAANVTLSNVTITGFNHDDKSAGIFVKGNSKVTLTNVTSNNNGVGLLATAGNITINGTSNSFQNNIKSSGIYIDNAAQLVSLANTNLSGNQTDGIHLNGTQTYTTTFSNITSNNNTGNGFYITNPNITLNASAITGDKNKLDGLAITAGTVVISGTANSFSSNYLGGIDITETGMLTNLQNATLSNNGMNGLFFGGVQQYLATLSSVTSNENGVNGYYVVNENVTVNASSLIGNANNQNGFIITAGTANITDTSNSFNNNTMSGIATDYSGVLKNLENITTSSNGADGITFAGTGAYTSTLTSVSSTSNSGNGYNLENSNLNLNASDITGSSNILNGLAISAGSATITGATTTFSSNTLSGISISSSGQLSSVSDATVSSNGVDGITLGGTGTYTSTLTNINSNNNTGNGITLNNSNVVVNATVITANSNNVGLQILYGKANITGTGTDMEINNFNSNKYAGISVDDSGTGILNTVQNSTILSNGADTGYEGIYLGGSGVYTTPANFSNINVSQNGGDGIWVINPNMNITATNMIVTQNGHFGLQITDGAINITDSGNQNHFTGNGADGIYVGGTASTFSFANIDASNNDGNGVWVDNPNATLTITGIIANGNVYSGMEIDQGKVSILGSEDIANSFSGNILYFGIFVPGPGGGSKGAYATGQLNDLQYTTVYYNGIEFGLDGIYLGNSGTYTATFSNVDSSANFNNGITLNGANITLNATDVTVNDNYNNGVEIIHGTLNARAITANDNINGIEIVYGSANITGSSLQMNDISNNWENGIIVDEFDPITSATATGQLNTLEYATLNNNSLYCDYSCAAIYLASTPIVPYTTSVSHVSLSNNTISVWALNGATINLVATNINELSYVLVAYANSQITITDPTTLVGRIYTDGANSQITVAIPGYTYTVANGTHKDCSITGGSGSCA